MKELPQSQERCNRNCPTSLVPRPLTIKFCDLPRHNLRHKGTDVLLISG